MIIHDGDVYRNLQEQVLKNKEDIEQYRITQKVIADYGIHVLGTYETAEELPQTAEIGDAFLIGSEPPYNVYIWTRTVGGDPAFVNVGPLSVQGPKGEKGDKGDKGEKGDTGPRGPQGVQGIQGVQGPKGDTGPRGLPGQDGQPGPRGDAGGFIHIAGILDGVSQLPTPSSLGDTTIAYLVNDPGFPGEPDLYIQIGTSSETAEWRNAGVLNVASYITENDEFIEFWDAGKKLDKLNLTDNEYRVIVQHGKDTIGNKYSDTPGAGFIAQFDSSGKLKTGTPTRPDHCVNLEYFNDNSGPLYLHIIRLVFGSPYPNAFVSLMIPSRSSTPIKSVSQLAENGFKLPQYPSYGALFNFPANGTFNDSYNVPTQIINCVMYGDYKTGEEEYPIYALYLEDAYGQYKEVFDEDLASPFSQEDKVITI